jgi:hypothetical protein
MTGAPAAVSKRASQSPLTRRLPGTTYGRQRQHGARYRLEAAAPASRSVALQRSSHWSCGCWHSLRRPISVACSAIRAGPPEELHLIDEEEHLDKREFDATDDNALGPEAGVRRASLRDELRHVRSLTNRHVDGLVVDVERAVVPLRPQLHDRRKATFEVASL